MSVGALVVGLLTGASGLALEPPPSPQRRLGPQGVKSEAPFTRWDAGLRRDDELALQDTPPPEEPEDPLPNTPDEEGRRRPGVPQHELEDPVTQDNPGAVRAPPPEAFPTDQIPVPDRWRLAQSLGLVNPRWFDPYNQNTFKGDRPLDPEKWPLITGDDWFFAANLVSDTVIEPRTFPIPVGVQTTQRPGSLDVFGEDASYVVSQTFIAGAALIKGSTAFMPPHIEYRVTLALNVNYVNVPERRVLFVEPSKGTDRLDHFLGVQE
ncbi:MAG: hypothetical protein ABWX67_07605, partial [Allosphingosinicella sp.]